ncbi:MAG TPA: hypothetical protein VMS56_02905 [Thermoanaerobaculia bacterium]|nr:hypothetical protein [Thermoanaerobaculia bacterium]
MSSTRRDFLIRSGLALSVAAVGPVGLRGSEAAAVAPRAPAAEPGWIAGDPYTASACPGGLGGRSFDAAREQALRFRMPDRERDRILLGLEI